MLRKFSYLTLAVAGIGAVLALHREHPMPLLSGNSGPSKHYEAEVEARVDARLRRLEEELAQLVTERAQLREEVAELNLVASSGGSANEPGGDVIAAAEIETIPAAFDAEDEAEREIQTAEMLDRLVTAEREPSRWSVDFELDVADVMRSDEMRDSHLFDVRCGGNVCRVHLSHDDGEAQLRIAEDLPLTPPFNTEGMIRFTGSDDNPETVVYVARRGERLPELP